MSQIWASKKYAYLFFGVLVETDLLVFFFQWPDQQKAVLDKPLTFNFYLYHCLFIAKSFY